MQIVSPRHAELVTFSKILAATFRIPRFQRLYSWEREQWEALVADLDESFQHQKPLFLGMCVLAMDGEAYDVIDGQQRLTTLALLLGSMERDAVLQRFDDGRTQTFITPQEPDGSWLKKLLNNDVTGDPARYSQRLMQQAYQYFCAREFSFDAAHINDSELILYCAPGMYGATSLFEKINTRGMSVSSMELVKNRLFDWTSRLIGDEVRSNLERDIVERFSSIFRHVNPFYGESAIDTHELLTVHWILFDDDYTKTTDFSDMAKEVDDFLNKKKQSEFSDRSAYEVHIANLIREYLSSLEDVAVYWRKVTSPRFVVTGLDSLSDGLLSFERLKRDANFVPMLVAALRRWGEHPKTTKFVQLVEIVCFREALARAQSNSGRTKKWALAKRIFRGEIDDGAAVQEVFWQLCPWWDEKEVAELFPDDLGTVREGDFASSAFTDPDAYDRFYRYMRYFFWEYGKWLPKTDWPEAREDISVQSNDSWESEFSKLEVEHIFPRNPKDQEKREVRERIKQMRAFLNHWGNLTLLTKKDNASLQNSVFGDKLDAVLKYNSNLVFNKLLANPSYRGNLSQHAWSPNNCKRRANELQKFADQRWGRTALQKFGIKKGVSEVPL